MIAYSQKYEVKINIFRNETRKSYEKEISSNSYESPSFQSRYSFYDGAKHERDYLYPMTREVMGSWKHFNLSKSTLAERHRRETSPLVSRELDRLVSPRTTEIVFSLWELLVNLHRCESIPSSVFVSCVQAFKCLRMLK